MIKSSWSSDIDSKLKEDFITLVNSVFGNFLTEELFKTKYVDNIYGPSLLTVAYVDGEPAGVDAMWRNDVCGMKAYQTVDTCVLEQYRGMGLFKRITHYEMDLLGEDAWVYGYPNVNSYPGYVKMGWKVERLYKTWCFLHYAGGKAIDVIDENYVKWWLANQNGITYLNRKEGFFLIRKNKTKPVAVVLGKVDEKTAKLFPETKGFLLFKVFDKRCSFYNKKKSIPLIYNKETKDIPYWKIDAI